MKISLKRAKNLSDAALKLAATDKQLPPLLTKLSIYSEEMNALNASMVDQATRETRSKLLEQHELALKLIVAAYAIRHQLAQENLAHGITSLLNRKAQLEAQEKHYRALLKLYDDAGEYEKTAEAARNRAAAQRKQPSDRFSRIEERVSVLAVSQADVDGWRNKLAVIVEGKTENSDALTSLNVTYTIELADETIATLREARLLSQG